MQKRLFISIMVLAISISFLLCQRDKQALLEPEEYPPKPPKPFYHPELVEDTTRIWLTPQGDTLDIYPKAIYARFYPWVTDTNQIWELLDKHNLEVPQLGRPSKSGETTYYDLFLCITDNRRAEYHMTPYGRDDLHNFGANSMVEFCFSMFSDGTSAPNGNIIFEFIENTPQTKMDSLFDANGLRFIHVYPASDSKHYETFITRKAKVNVLDLACYLKQIPFVKECWVGFIIRASRIPCE